MRQGIFTSVLLDCSGFANSNLAISSISLCGGIEADHAMLSWRLKIRNVVATHRCTVYKFLELMTSAEAITRDTLKKSIPRSRSNSEHLEQGRFNEYLENSWHQCDTLNFLHYIHPWKQSNADDRFKRIHKLILGAYNELPLYCCPWS